MHMPLPIAGHKYNVATEKTDIYGVSLYGQLNPQASHPTTKYSQLSRACYTKFNVLGRLNE